MLEPEAQANTYSLYECENEVREFDDADSLSTNENKQMDGEMEEMNEEDRQDTSSGDLTLELNEELEAGYKILTDLMSHSKRAANWPFMESIEDSDPELFAAYRQRIEKPVWLKLMKQKFEDHQYTTITEFVSDFRLMLENCYRFNGPDHYISKRAQKMETMLEQKLALLPREFREKTTIDATTDQKSEASSISSGLRRRPKTHVLHDSTYLLNQLREAEYQKKREYRIRQIMARRAERTALAQEIMDWEEKMLFDGKKDRMKAMWEIPQIGLFLFLCQEPLNIGEVMHFELERCFMMSRESSTMQLIMTSLLSTPFQRLKLDRKKLMPYRVWEQKLRVKLQSWYKVYTDMEQDVEKTCFKLGLEEQFFDVVGQKNPLERKRFHEIGFYRKVWIMKSLCDNCLHQQDSLRETIENQPFEDQREYLLGTDNTGQRYIHFPQFCGADVRVYRQAPVKYPKIEIKPDPFNNKRKFPFVYKPPPLKKVKLKKKKRHRVPQSKPASENVSPMSSPQRQRPSRLRQAPKSVVPLQLLDDTSITEDTSSSSSDEDLSAAETQEPDKRNEPSTSADVSEFVPDQDEQSLDTERDGDIDDHLVDRLSSGSDATLPYCDNSDSNSNMSSQEHSRESSPYPSCSDLSLRFSSQIDRSSDVSQESSPCPSPADFGLRRGMRTDRSSDTSRDASPLIFDSDYGLRRSSRNRARLKNIPPLKAARNLSSFLFEENSASNSSVAGESSLSGMGTSLFKDDTISRRSSKSSEMTEESNDCDINVSKLFANSRTCASSTGLSVNFHKVLNRNSENLMDNFLASDQHEIEEKNKMNLEEKEVALVEDHSGDDCEDSKDVHKTDYSVDNDANITFASLKDLPVEVEKVLYDSKSAINSVNGGTECMEDDSYSKNDNINSQDIAPCDAKEELALETGQGRSGPLNDTGKESKSVPLNSGENSVNDNLAALQDHERHFHGQDNEREGIYDRNLVNTNEAQNVQNTVNNECGVPESFSPTAYVKEMESNIEEIKMSSEEKEKVKGEIVNDSEESSEVVETEIKFEIVNKKEKESKYETNIVGNDFENKTTVQIKVEPKSEMLGHQLSDVKPKAERDQVKEEDTKSDAFDAGDKIKMDIDSLKTDMKKEDVKIKTESGKSAVDDIKTEAVQESASSIGDIETAPKKEELEESEEIEAKIEKLEESEDEEEMTPDPKQFEMVADSVEEVRKLAEQFAEPEPIVFKRGKKEQIQRPPPRKKNIVILHERLQYLLKELEPWESKLQQATKRARLRLRKEMEDYLLKPPEEKDDDWKSADEETESGESDTDNKDTEEEERKTKPKVADGKASAANSRCSTPVKPPEEVDEIDISHRGRLRKRRIIPNNVEDQLGVKKPKQVKSDVSQSTPTSSQPVIVQSGKTQLVDYADIIRQLKNTGGNTPILIKTTQGGRTVLTSVLPVCTNSNNNSSTASTSALQTVRIVSPSAGSSSTVTAPIQPQAVRIAVPGGGTFPATSKALQHPTIQNLLSGTVAGSKLLPKTAASVTVTGNIQSPVELSSVILPPTPEKTQAQKFVLPNQTTPQKVVPGPVNTPRKIAPHTTASDNSGKPKAKYYAANASTLPINVVEQLIATRGARLSQGAYNQSILLIPMENEGQTRNVVSSAAVTPVKTQLSPATTPNGKTVKADNTAVTSTSSSLKTSPTTPILPKPQTSPVMSLGQGIPALQIQQGLGGIQRPQAFIQPAVVDGMNVTRLVPLGISPKSPTRYPTNETVKTLLEKRKPLEEKETFVLEKRKMPAVTKISNTVSNNGSNIVSRCDLLTSNSVPKSGITNQNLVQSNSLAGLVRSTNAKSYISKPTIMTVDPVKTESLVSAVKSQQCVITSISAAKLNTLLLQTSAAGAKSIPSLIKLPSKAALDSAVKAVVTSVNTTLPTVNIKVPSPTSLPSIGPRRNVTKTIQTMKSPIPVAPKFVTQSSGGQTTLSYADSHTTSSSQMLTVSSSSVQGSVASVSEVSVNHSQIMTGSQDQDGKRVVTRLAPQLVLTPKGVMQMGYVNTGNLAGAATSVSQVAVPSSSVQSGNQSILIQNSAGQYQLIQQTSPVLQQVAQGTSLQQITNQSATQSRGQGQNLLQTIKPVVALNASGNPIILPTVKSNTQLASASTPPSIVLHNSTYYTANQRKPLLNIVTASSNSTDVSVSPSVPGNSGLKSPSAGLLLQQATSGMLQTVQRPVISQSGMVSPLLGLQQGLVLQGGVQLASPVVNQIGLNLLQPGVQTIQNPSTLQVSTPQLLQKAGTAGPHLLNINPLLLNTALTTASGGVLRQQLNTQLAVASANQLGAKMGLTTVVRPSVPSLQQQSKSPLPTSAMVPSTVAIGQNGSGLVSPLPQMIQMPGSSLVVPALGTANQQLNLLGQLAATPASAQKQLVFQYPSVCQAVTTVVTQPSQPGSIAKYVVSLPNKQTANNQEKATLSVTKLQTPLRTQAKVVITDAGDNVAKSDNFLTTVAVNQVTLGQKTSPTQQKLLLFSIGGQLVTGQGVPVSLSDGVLKVVPHGKIKINNQTLTPEQIKQTLAKINEAAAMTLNPANRQQTPTQQTGSSAMVDQGKVIPVKIVKDSKNEPGPSVAAIDHTYLNCSKEKIVTSLMNGNTSVPVVSQVQLDIGTCNNSTSLVTSKTGLQVANSDSVNNEQGKEMQFPGQANETQYDLKPMGYSSGYVVRQRTLKQEENGEKPGFASQNFNIGKLIVDKEAKRFVIKAPMKNDLSGLGDASNSANSQKLVPKVKADDEEDESDDKLVIDDGVSDKEAAMNLLTLANQAPAPVRVKAENNKR